jgi:sulfate permease, SulP family
MSALTKKIQDRLWGPSIQNLLPGLSAGLVIGLLSIFTNISFAAILFSGELSGFVARGIGLMLLGAVFSALVGIFFGTFSANVIEPQDGPVAVLSVISVAIASSIAPAASAEEKFLTVVAVIIVTSMMTGIFFYLVGHFNLGNLVRYIPFPVMGGFLAGAGWLLTIGSIGVMVDVPVGTELFQPDILMRWLPGVIFAILFIIILNRFSQFWVMPAFMAASTILFFLFFKLFVGPVETALANGWLLGPFPEGELWQPFIVQVIPLANWQLVLGHITDISTIILVSAITFLLNLSAISVGINQEIDMNRELKVNGIANLLGSLGGFSVSYTSFSSSIWGHRLSGGSGLVSVVVALISGVTFFVGASLLSYFPRLIAGGLLLFWGLSFMQEYLIDARKKLPWLEYLLMWVIVFIVALVGFLEGVLVGILIAVVLFGANYSRTRTVRLTTTAASYQSQVQRPILYQQLLKKQGDKLLIMSLQGHIFFGSASSLFDAIKQAFETSKPDFAVLDFRLVTGIDSSAMLSITKIKQLAQANQVHLVFTDLDLVLEKRLIVEVLGKEQEEHWHIFPDLDEGLAWCESQLLERFESLGLVAKSGDIRKQWLDMLPRDDEHKTLDDLLSVSAVRQGLRSQEDSRLERLEPYLEAYNFDSGDVLVEEEDCFGGLILLEFGQVMSQVLDVSGTLLNIKLFDEGAIVGVAGCYAKRNTILSVIATEPSHVFMLSEESIERMDKEEPELAIALHRLIVSQLSERNLYLDDMVQALQF